MTGDCDRCGRAPRPREAPVQKVVIPFLLSVTRMEPVDEEPGWVEIESGSETLSLCPDCARMPALPPPGEDPDGKPEEDAGA